MRNRLRTLIPLLLAALLAAGCAGGQPDGTPSAAAPTTTMAAPTTVAPTTTAAPKPVKMPDLVRYTYNDALEILVKAGVPEDAVDYVSLGQENTIIVNGENWLVIEYKPAKGQTWKPGTQVRLGVVHREEAPGIEPRL